MKKKRSITGTRAGRRIKQRRWGTWTETGLLIPKGRHPKRKTIRRR